LLWQDEVAGVTVTEALDRACTQGDAQALQQLYESWHALLVCLYEHRIAHGDLAGGNIMVRENGALTLVDYDGCYIPAFAGKHAIVDGHLDYQHPNLVSRPFDERMDRFSSLLITAALLAMREAPELWKQFARYDPQGKFQSEHLLWTRTDLLHPMSSAVFQALERLRDPLAREVVQALAVACQCSPDETPQVLGIIDSDFECRLALKVLERAIQAKDPRAIIGAWIPALEGFAQAQRYLPTVGWAVSTQRALCELRQACLADDDQRVIVSAQAVPQDAHVPAELAARVDLARRRFAMVEALRLAIVKDDDDAILAALDPDIPISGTALTQQERRRVSIAEQRHGAMEEIAALLAKGRVEAAIARTVNAHLVPKDRRFLVAVRQFLATQTLTGLTTWRQGEVVELRWTWPRSQLIDSIAVIASAAGPPGRSRAKAGSSDWVCGSSAGCTVRVGAGVEA